MATWEWKPVRKWPDVYFQFLQGSESEIDSELGMILQRVVAGAERWSDDPKERVIVLGFEEAVPSILLRVEALNRLRRALERARTGRWRIECCALSESQVRGFNTYPLVSRLTPTPLGQIPLFAHELWPDDFGRDLRRWWARNVASLEKLEIDGDMRGEDVSWLEDWGVWPFRLIERWPDPSRVDFIVLEPNVIDSWRGGRLLAGLVPSVFAWLSEEVVRHLGMPCEVRLVRWPSGQIESVEGETLAKVPELEALEEKMARASRCRSEPERQFFWAAEKAHIPLEPAVRVDPYELDFALPNLKIGVEIDGYQHHAEYDQREKDYSRERVLQRRGWQIVRYTAREVLNNPAACIRNLKTILNRGQRNAG